MLVPHMKLWTGQSLIVQRFMATTATVPPQRLSDVEWSKRVRTRQVEVVICGGADSDMTWHGVSQNGKPRLPPFHSRVWQTSPFLEMLCHYVMIVMAVDGGVSQWYSCLFLCHSLQKSWKMSCLRQASLPSGPPLLLHIHGLWQVPARRGE